MIILMTLTVISSFVSGLCFGYVLSPRKAQELEREYKDFRTTANLFEKQYQKNIERLQRHKDKLERDNKKYRNRLNKIREVL